MGDLAAAVATGELERSLVALRDHLAEALEAAEPRYKAPLARQLQDVIARLDAVPRDTGSVLDDLTARRAARGASTSLGPAGGESAGSGRGRRVGGARGSAS